MYLTYQKYIELGGVEKEMPFKLLEFEAEQEIKRRTFGRIIETNETIQMCVFKLIELLKNYTDNNVASESIDGYSVAYKDNKNKNDSIKEIINTYLCDEKINGIPVLYRGL